MIPGRRRGCSLAAGNTHKVEQQCQNSMLSCINLYRCFRVNQQCSKKKKPPGLKKSSRAVQNYYIFCEMTVAGGFTAPLLAWLNIVFKDLTVSGWMEIVLITLLCSGLFLVLSKSHHQRQTHCWCCFLTLFLCLMLTKIVLLADLDLSKKVNLHKQ